jgi:putative hydrolase of the HAD superfamily
MKALVLDYGGVISKTPFEDWRNTEKALGLPKGSITITGPLDPSKDPEWRAMQAGEMTEREYWFQMMGRVCKMVGEDWRDMQTFIRRGRGNDPLRNTRPEALATIKAAKEAGCKLAILSNELDLFYGPEMRKKLTFLEDFDTIVDATYTKILKPDPRAFAFVTDALNMAAEDCVFVDDQMKNIKGGVAAGMDCVHFDVTKPAESYQEVREKLGIELWSIWKDQV